MEYKSANSGLLAPSMVKDGDKVILLEPAYSTFSETKQKTYWNCKVQLPNGDHRLAGLMEMVCDAFADKWGSDTEAWKGHTATVEIRTAKSSGNPYIVLVPTDDEVIDVGKLISEKENIREKVEKTNVVKGKLNPPIEYPADEINPDDIPF